MTVFLIINSHSHACSSPFLPSSFLYFPFSFTKPPLISHSHTLPHSSTLAVHHFSDFFHFFGDYFPTPWFLSYSSTLAQPFSHPPHPFTLFIYPVTLLPLPRFWRSVPHIRLYIKRTKACMDRPLLVEKASEEDCMAPQSPLELHVAVWKGTRVKEGRDVISFPVKSIAQPQPSSSTAASS